MKMTESPVATFMDRMGKISYYYWVFLLFGYVFLNKGFAYVGFAPIYVSEIGLFLGFLGTLAVIWQKRAHWERMRTAIAAILGVFLLWQIIRTIPYLMSYRLDAVRDAMLWGYSAYAIFILIAFNDEAIKTFFKIYTVLIPFILVWLFPAQFLIHLYGIHIPFGGSPNLLLIKAGDVGVHLAGIAAFLLLRLDERYGKPSYPSALRWFLWVLWWLTWIMFGSGNRGGMLSALVAFSVLFFIRKHRWFIPLLIGVLLTAALYFIQIGFSIPNSDQSAVFSSSSIIGNLQSTVTLAKEVVAGKQTEGSGNSLPVFGQYLPKPVIIYLGNSAASASSVANLLGFEAEERFGTFRWRVNWWKTIIGYTFHGTYFWGGKGYGINLAAADGFTVKSDNKLRSPHNATMTVLARSGAPGLLLWLILLAAIGFSMFRKVVSKHHPAPYRELLLWMMVYWLAFLLNSSVDVFLEGPMGGIWFWSLTGMALVLLLDENHSFVDGKDVGRIDD
jgi:hypothetical protein